MGRLFVAANGDHLSVVSPAVTVKPLTMACWYKPTSFTALAMLMTLQSNTTALRHQSLGVAASTGLVNATERGNTGSSTAPSASGMTLGVWGHVAVSFALTGTGQRIAYLNGVAGTPTSANVGATPVVPERTDIGGYFPVAVGTFANLPDGVIAMPAIWSAILSAAEIAVLARGISPYRIRSSKLVFYPYSDGRVSPEPDYTAGQRHLTVTGTSQAGNPPAMTMAA